jgi:hypothetical protein
VHYSLEQEYETQSEREKIEKLSKRKRKLITSVMAVIEKKT